MLTIVPNWNISGQCPVLVVLVPPRNQRCMLQRRGAPTQCASVDLSNQTLAVATLHTAPHYSISPQSLGISPYTAALLGSIDILGVHRESYCCCSRCQPRQPRCAWEWSREPLPTQPITLTLAPQQIIRSSTGAVAVTVADQIKHLTYVGW